MSSLASRPPRFSASVTFLYSGRKGASVASHAMRAGFSAVEFQVTERGQAEEFAPHLKAAGLPVALLNLDVGDFLIGGPGLAGVPGRQDLFTAALERGFREAKLLGAKVVQVGPSRIPQGASRKSCLAQLRENLQRARDRMGELAIPVALEALNSREYPDILSDDPDEIADLIESFGSDGLGMQYDIYHAAASSRDIPADLKKFAGQLIHVQFADHPGRHEPGTGSLPLAEYFELLGQLGYCGYLGAEYKPNQALDESLGWIRAYRTESSTRFLDIKGTDP